MEKYFLFSTHNGYHVWRSPVEDFSKSELKAQEQDDGGPFFSDNPVPCLQHF